jgi:hypothetical protein
MPRNPHKTRCHMPGCGSWAMRGHTLCRAHRDFELGPRAAGAPAGNLNALTTGKHAQPLSRPELNRLAATIAREPDRLSDHLAPVIHSVQDRTTDPHKAIAALSATLSQLLPLVTEHLVASELRAFGRRLPPEARETIGPFLSKTVRRISPDECLTYVRLMGSMIESRINLKTITGTGTHSHDPTPRPQP